MGVCVCAELRERISDYIKREGCEGLYTESLNIEGSTGPVCVCVWWLLHFSLYRYILKFKMLLHIEKIYILFQLVQVCETDVDKILWNNII